MLVFLTPAFFLISSAKTTRAACSTTAVVCLFVIHMRPTKLSFSIAETAVSGNKRSVDSFLTGFPDVVFSEKMVLTFLRDNGIIQKLNLRMRAGVVQW